MLPRTNSDDDPRFAKGILENVLYIWESKLVFKLKHFISHFCGGTTSPRFLANALQRLQKKVFLSLLLQWVIRSHRERELELNLSPLPGKLRCVKPFLFSPFFATLGFISD